MKKRNRTAIVLMSLGALFIVIGSHNGEIQVVLNKAIRICLECIGIG